MSPRVSAHLGLGAAASVLILSVLLLHTGASEAKYALRAHPSDKAPAFVLSNASGESVSLASERGRTVVLCFSAIACPVSNDYRQRLADFARRYSTDRRVRILQVNLGQGLPLAAKSSFSALSEPSSNVLPDAGSERLLLDPKCEVARQYAVELTPTFFVIDSSGVIRYRGSFDDNRNAAQVKNCYCEDALDDVLHDRAVAEPVTASFGCTLKQ